MRLFVAVYLPTDLQEVVWRAGDKIRGEWRREPQEKLHITLKFLGGVPDERLGELDRVLRSIKHPTFYVEVKGVGAFPSWSNPRVLWVGAHSKGLFSLQSLVEEKVFQLGIPREWREFVPHITLGRAKGRVDVSGFRKLEGKYFGTFQVREFSLVKSTLTPSGSIYEVIRSYGLED